jgi:EAL and modified HD-GYP domain-containing signal transduction protein
MPDILERVEVAGEVREALIEREGQFGVMLRVVELLERAEGGRALSAALKKLGLTVGQMRDIELAAFEWVQELAHEVH